MNPMLRSKALRGALVALLSTHLALAQTAPQAAATAQPATPQAEPAVTDVGITDQQVFDLWMRTSREVASWRSQIGAARFDVVTATLWPNPDITLGGTATYINPDNAPDGVYNWGPQVNIPLPIFGQIRARENEATAALRVAEVNVAETMWERASELQQAMLERAFADARAVWIRRNLDELARIDQIVHTRATAGSNSAYDVLRVSTTEATFRAALSDSLSDRDSAEARLVALMAAPGVTAIPITRAGMAPFRGPENESALVRLALQRRPDLELARRGVAAAEATAARYRREVIPVPSVMVGQYVTHVPFSVTAQVGLSFTLPVSDRNQGLIGRALTEADGQRELAVGVEARIRAEVAGAWRAREASKASLATFRAVGLAATAELLERAEVSYRAGGTFQIMDLLDAYRAVWDARAQELELERNVADAEVELERAAALLTQ